MTALGTSALRVAWSPACRAKDDVFRGAYIALNMVFRAFHYVVGPGSGAYNCRAITNGTGYSLHSYGPGTIFSWWSGRAFAMALAVDINPAQNPYGPRLVTNMSPEMIKAVHAIRTRNGKQVWVWGGVWSPHDAMHFQISCTRADLVTGIDPTTLPGAVNQPPQPTPQPQPTPTPTPKEDEPVIKIEWFKDATHTAAYKVLSARKGEGGNLTRYQAFHIKDPAELERLRAHGYVENSDVHPVAQYKPLMRFEDGPFKNI